MRALRNKLVLGGVAAFASLACAAPAALASTAGIDGQGVLQYAGAAGEANHLRIYFDMTYSVYVIEDTGVASIAVTGKSCNNYTGQIAYCPYGKFSAINVRLGDAGGYAADELRFTRVTMSGGAGNDTLIGGGGFVTLVAGAGKDTLTAGSGETRLVGGSGETIMNAGSGHTSYQGGSGVDRVTARNAIAEQVSCGAGVDSVDADTGDTVAADCEQVSRGTAPEVQTPDPGGAPSTLPGDLDGAAPFDPPLVAISRAPVTVDSHARVPVGLACPSGAATGCDGTLTLTLPAPRSTRGKLLAARRRVIGRKRFRLTAGKKGVVRVALSRRGARIFKARRSKRRRVKVAVTVSMRTEAGATTRKGTITVKAARRRPAPRKRRH